jgi:hypothetical protein
MFSGRWMSHYTLRYTDIFHPAKAFFSALPKNKFIKKRGGETKNVV